MLILDAVLLFVLLLSIGLLLAIGIVLSIVIALSMIFNNSCRENDDQYTLLQVLPGES